MNDDQETNPLQIYSDHADRYELAHAAHRRTYETRIPPPVRQIVRRENRLTLVMLGVIVTASVVVSGSRTVSEFGGGIFGGAAFVMLECAIVLFALLFTRTDYDATSHSNVKRRFNQGKWLAFLVAVAANVDVELKHNGIIVSELLTISILIILGISAPVLALITGDAFGMYAVKDEQRQRKADDEYRAALSVWTEGLRSSWDREKNKWGIKGNVVEISIPEVSNGNSNGKEAEILPSASILGHKKQPMATDIVQRYFQEHPEAVDQNPIEIASILDVGKSTVYNVLKAMERQKHLVGSNGNGNGNGHHE